MKYVNLPVIKRRQHHGYVSENATIPAPYSNYETVRCLTTTYEAVGPRWSIFIVLAVEDIFR